jgi:hypothetical protein
LVVWWGIELETELAAPSVTRQEMQSVLWLGIVQVML